MFTRCSTQERKQFIHTQQHRPEKGGAVTVSSRKAAGNRMESLQAGSVCDADICAVFDDHGVRHFADFTACSPGHICAGQAGEIHGRELLNQFLTDIGIAHISSDPCIFTGLCKCKDAVVSICRKLVGNLADTRFVVLDKGLCEFILGVRVERSQQIDALSERFIKAFQGQDSIHAVHTKESGGIAHGFCLILNLTQPGPFFLVFLELLSKML